MALAITDSSVLIGLEHIGRLDLLPATFPEVAAPAAVVAEFGQQPAWLRVETVENRAAVQALQARRLDLGEAEAIVLAQQNEASTLLMDERRGRRYARSVGVQVLGTAGLLLQAKEDGLIEAVRPMLDALRASGFRLADPLYAQVLRLAGEASS